MPVPELITECQVADRFNLSVNTLRYWRAVDEGPPFVKIGRLVRYDVAALERYVQRNTCGSNARVVAREAM